MADLPGAVMSDIKVDMDTNNVLRIVAEKSDAVDADETRGGFTIHRSERTTGRQSRAIQLPAYADANKVTCSFDNGVLRIVARKLEGIEAGGRRRIAVAAAAVPRTSTA